MRRIIILVVGLTAIVMSMVPAHAGTVTRTILVPTVVAGGNEGNCLPGPDCEKTILARHHRCAYTADPAAAQDGSTGRFGYTIPVTGGATFTLKPAAGSTGDFDVAFYDALGTCSGVVAAPLGNTIPPGASNPLPATRTDAYDGTHFGNESGTIPAAAKFAIITLFGDANQKFTFTF